MCSSLPTLSPCLWGWLGCQDENRVGTFSLSHHPIFLALVEAKFTDFFSNIRCIMVYTVAEYHGKVGSLRQKKEGRTQKCPHLKGKHLKEITGLIFLGFSHTHSAKHFTSLSPPTPTYPATLESMYDTRDGFSILPHFPLANHLLLNLFSSFPSERSHNPSDVYRSLPLICFPPISP